jgi:hypothetical protein
MYYPATTGSGGSISNPSGLDVDTTFGIAFIANQNASGALSIVDVTTNAELPGSPVSVGPDPDGVATLRFRPPIRWSKFRHRERSLEYGAPSFWHDRASLVFESALGERAEHQEPRINRFSANEVDLDGTACASSLQTGAAAAWAIWP